VNRIGGRRINRCRKKQLSNLVATLNAPWGRVREESTEKWGGRVGAGGKKHGDVRGFSVTKSLKQLRSGGDGKEKGTEDRGRAMHASGEPLGEVLNEGGWVKLEQALFKEPTINFRYVSTLK